MLQTVVSKLLYYCIFVINKKEKKEISLNMLYIITVYITNMIKAILLKLRSLRMGHLHLYYPTRSRPHCPQRRAPQLLPDCHYRRPLL